VSKDGEVREVSIEFDAVLIEYLGDGCYGRLPSLSVDRGDRNRVLLSFDVSEGADFERAELRLTLHRSPIPTSAPLELGLFSVLEPWSDGAVTWNTQPKFEREPAQCAAVGPAEGPVVLDVTELARRWAETPESNHGVLLRAAVPISLPPPGLAAAVEREFEHMLPWAPTLRAALTQAKGQDKEVLVVVTAAFRQESLTDHERLLFVTCLSHPAVRDAITARFVPVRVRVSPNDVACAADGMTVRTAALEGTELELLQAQPPALVR
jgi:hypothetical protein